MPDARPHPRPRRRTQPTDARAARLAAQHAIIARSTLADGNQASVGDAILTRRNDRRLGVSGTDWVKNGDRWTVTAVTATAR